jgi:hypothetical protein
MDMKRFFLYFITIAALALAGCGGNGTSPATTMEDFEAKYNAAKTSLMSVLGMIDASLTADSTDAEIMDAINALEGDAKEEVLAGMRTALGLTNNEDQTMIVANIRERLGSPLPAPTAKTMGVTFAILGSDKPNNPSTYAGIDAMTRPGKATDGDRILTRAGDSTTDMTAALAVGVAGPFGDQDLLGRIEMIDDPDSDDTEDMVPDPENFMEMAGSETSLSKDFTSTNYMRSVTNDDGTTTDEIAVITDMKDPGALSFASYYTVARAGVDGMAITAEPNDNTEPPVGRITLEVNEDNTNFNVSKVYASDFPMIRDQEFTYVADDDATEDVDESEREFAGTFNGIAGMYSCTGTTCSAGTDEDGKLDNLDGTWTFDPDDVKSMIPGVDHDGDFLAFGWWLRGTAHNEDSPYQVGTFATGSVPYTVAMAQRLDVTGTAKYSGPAAGKFARKTLNSDGSVAGLIAGHFTADASLTATFGQTSTSSLAPNQLHSIHGYVDDFRDGDGNTIDRSWNTMTGRVNLMKAGFGDGPSLNTRDDTLPDETFGGVTNGNGNWQGRFFGPATNADAEMAKPSGVAGEFTNHWSNGHVIGAFGATQDE